MKDWKTKVESKSKGKNDCKTKVFLKEKETGQNVVPADDTVTKACNYNIDQMLCWTAVFYSPPSNF